ncbi:nicotinamidase-related amidase [Scopulibacillus darangshiensis]|uniref:Nicotinamidase-related amidase n=1 Tax=Scopulibacillus darangshiensis TaxID=442528 RepID=A0A4V2SNC1_9BACL|nr:hydrolase [Scopulibacillus darangshiensis]TCP30556.1 nicotinamidase-related amidase [Scopulibacillus darangshiensis]
MKPLNIDVKKTALVVIDLQEGIVGLKGEPFDCKEVLEKSVRLADVFREKGGFVTLVHVDFLDGQDALKPQTDNDKIPSGERPENFAKIVPELGPKDGDLVVTKRQWGAFFGTDLDLQLRRRGIDTIILCGIATNIGVETTAREAFQRNYGQIFVIDAMTGLTKEEHNHTEKYLFPKMGRVRKTEDILNEL